MLILGIDSSTSILSVALGDENRILDEIFIDKKHSHSEKIHSTIEEILKKFGLELEEIDLFAISSGPGSYTGLRIGYSTLHGFITALGKPSIGINTLESITWQAKKHSIDKSYLLAPMLDAKRMEVYNLVSTTEGEIIFPSRAIIIDQNTFKELESPILVFGDGAKKSLEVLSIDFKYLENIFPKASDLIEIARLNFNKDELFPMPFYLKDVYISSSLSTNNKIK